MRLADQLQELVQKSHPHALYMESGVYFVHMSPRASSRHTDAEY